MKKFIAGLVIGAVFMYAGMNFVYFTVPRSQFKQAQQEILEGKLTKYTVALYEITGVRDEETPNE